MHAPTGHAGADGPGSRYRYARLVTRSAGRFGTLVSRRGQGACMRSHGWRDRAKATAGSQARSAHLSLGFERVAWVVVGGLGGTRVWIWWSASYGTAGSGGGTANHDATEGRSQIRLAR